MQTSADANDKRARTPERVIWLHSNNEVLADAKLREPALLETDSMRLYEEQHPDRHDSKRDHNPDV